MEAVSWSCGKSSRNRVLFPVKAAKVDAPSINRNLRLPFPTLLTPYDANMAARIVAIGSGVAAVYFLRNQAEIAEAIIARVAVYVIDDAFQIDAHKHERQPMQEVIPAVDHCAQISGSMRRTHRFPGAMVPVTAYRYLAREYTRVWII